VLRQDYILRLVEELARAIARSLSRTKEQDFARAEAELDEAERRLGLFHGSERLDASSLARLLGGDKCVLYAKLLLARAEIAERRQQVGSQDAFRQRAKQLLTVARPGALADLKAELLEHLASLQNPGS